MRDLSETDAAYLAGLIDGEGCISVTRTATNAAAKGCRRGFAYRSSMAMNLTDLNLLTWAKEVTGVGKISPRKVSGNRRSAWCWAVWSKEASALVQAIRPYLKLKGPQADNLIRFQDLMRSPGSNGLTDFEWEERERLYLYSKKMNLRGLRAEQA